MSTVAYERITAQIIALLEQGTVPWHKPWKSSTAWPRNIVTNKPYRGINMLLLHCMGYESPYWLTFRQAIVLGGSVRRGEKACPVVFWKRIEDKDAVEERRIPLLRYYSVFNLAQCEGIKNGHPAAPGRSSPPLSSKPEEIVATMPQRPVIKNGFSRAFYSPREDYIGMPAQEQFSVNEAYYATLFHELIHSTGHSSRLNRSTLAEQKGFGSDPYCKEELIAEIGAAFLCGHAEITERTMDNSAAYIAQWLKRMKDDKRLVVQAAAQAQRAADFIIGLESKEDDAEA